MIAFSHFDFKTGKIGDLDRQFPTYLSAWDLKDDENYVHRHDKEQEAAHFIYCYEGPALIYCKNSERKFYLGSEEYAVISEDFMVTCGKGIIMTREGADFPFMMGGPIEEKGRLKYIDGCTDSLIIPPWKFGEGCLNHLHFPKNIKQTMHTHPSDRIGMVTRGRGECVAMNNGVQETIPLETGMIFCIHTDGVHKFNTYESSMDVIAFHPDSDFGPEDQFHPMINRTIVNGISASKIDEIRTK